MMRADRDRRRESGASPGEPSQAEEASERRSSVQLKGSNLADQQAALAPGAQSYAAQRQALVPVQMKGGAEGSVHAAAAHGTAGGGGALPFADKIQASFGRHDVSNVQAYTGGAATEATSAIGAEAYATGNKVAFGAAPSLHVAAHEAAHVVQQRAGVQLSGGTGKAGDSYEQHADAVADRVVAGQSAEALLTETTGGAASSGGAADGSVQCYRQYGASGDKDASGQTHWRSPGSELRVTEDGTVAVEQPSMFGSDQMYVLGSRVSAMNAALGANNVPIEFKAAGGSVKGAPPAGGSTQSLSQVKAMVRGDASQAAEIPDDCGRAAHTVTGAVAEGKTLKAEYRDQSGDDQNVKASHPEIMKLEIMAAHFKAQVPDAAKLVTEAQDHLNTELACSQHLSPYSSKITRLTKKVNAAVEEINDAAEAGDATRLTTARSGYKTVRAEYDKYMATVEPKTKRTLADLVSIRSNAHREKMKRIDAILAPYLALSGPDQEAFDAKVGINRHANPEVGQAYTISSGGAAKSDMTWNYHWGGVILKSTSGSDNVNMEGFAGSVGEIYYQVYGVPTADDKREGQTFHEQARDEHRQHGDAPTTMATEKM